MTIYKKLLLWIDDKPLHVLTTILILAILLRLIWGFVVYPILHPGPYSGDHYYIIAENLVNGYGYVDGFGSEKIPDVRRVPVYTFVLALIYKLFGVNIWAPKIFNCLFEGGTCVMIYITARKLFSNERVALLSSLLYACYVLSFTLVSRLITEPLYILLLMTFMFYYVRWFKNLNLKNALIAGFLLGIVSMTRPTTQAFPLFIVISLFWTRRRFPEILKNVIVFVIAMGIVMMPWIYRNYKVTGVPNLVVSSDYGGALWWITRVDYNMLKLDMPQIQEKAYHELGNISAVHKNTAETAEILTDQFLKGVYDNPLHHLSIFFKRFVAFWYIATSEFTSIRNMFINFPILLLGIFGLIRAYRRGITVIPVIALLLFFNIVHAVFFAFVRNAIPMIPFLLIFAVYALFSYRDNLNFQKGSQHVF